MTSLEKTMTLSGNKTKTKASLHVPTRDSGLDVLLSDNRGAGQHCVLVPSTYKKANPYDLI